MRQGKCEHCGREAWINKAMGRRTLKFELPEGEYCADCFDRYALGDIRRTPGPRDGPIDGTGASWDNVVNALEEDR